MQAYHSLEQKFARLNAIGDAIGMLAWDADTMMPDGAADDRSEALATLRAIAHDALVNPQIADLLEVAEPDHELDRWQRANLREMRRSYLHEAAVPVDLVEATSKATFRAERAWREARARGEFAILAAPLAEVLERKREIGQAKGEALKLSPYDALLDRYDPGLRQSQIDPLFGRLRADLPGLIQEAVERQKNLPPIVPLAGPFPVDIQRRLGEMLMKAVGFDFARGRLDVSLHPFCGGA